MHRVSVIVCCLAVIHYDYHRNRVSLYYLFEENKSFGTDHHLHSFSDIRKLCQAHSPYPSPDTRGTTVCPEYCPYPSWDSF
jgi:hypothetical protein